MKIIPLSAALAVLISATSSGVLAQGTGTSYNRVDEVMDWGAVTTQLIVDLGAEVSQGAVATDSFRVLVRRSDPRLPEPFLEEGVRKVLEAYVSDAEGKRAASGRYATLVMEVGPTVTLGSALNYAEDPSVGNRFNAWTDNAYRITQQKPIGSIAGGLVATELGTYTRLGVDEFELGERTYEDQDYGTIDMSYAHYAPAEDAGRNPLIVWLHGGGEGGRDATIPVAANKATVFVSAEVQAMFGGAYVLAPQSRTRWMHGPLGQQGGTEKGDALSIYTRATQDLIESFVKAQPDVDTNRIYIAGASNGGWLTVRLVLDHPDYYAAALAVAEPLKMEYVSDEELKGIVDLPLWLVSAATDQVVPPELFPVPLYTRLRNLGAQKVHFSFPPSVTDMSGKYFAEDGSPHEYNGHWSWVPTYNNHLAYVEGAGMLYGPIAREVKEVNGRKVVTVLEWLAAQTK